MVQDFATFFIFVLFQSSMNYVIWTKVPTLGERLFLILYTSLWCEFYIRSEIWAIAKGFSTIFTFALLLSSLDSPILSKAIAEVKGFVTPFTFVKLFSGMHSHMFGKVKAEDKGSATFSTFIRFLSSKRPLISGNI